MRAIKVITQLLITIVGIALCSASMLVLTAHSTANGTARVLDVAADRPMFHPGAVLDTAQVDDTRGVRDTAWEDAAAEGRDVLVLTYDDAPDALWNSLAELHPTWYDEALGYDSGEGAFYVPVGTSIPVPGGLYLATLDGWSQCTDGVTFAGECSATGPVVPATDMQDMAPPVQLAAHTTRTPHTFTKAERKAARYILARLKAHKPIEEDWTYAGAPRVVGAHNDALLDAAEAAGLHGNNWPWSSKARAWLSQVVRTGHGSNQSHSKA